MIQIVQHRTVNGRTGMFHPEGHPRGFAVPNHAWLFKNPDKVLALLNKPFAEPRVWKNLYYCMAHHVLPINDALELAGSELPIRNKKSFDNMPILAWDIDHCDTARAFEYLACVAGVLMIDPAELTLICTGNGLHVIAHLKTPIRSEKFLSECKPAYNELCAKMERAMQLAGLPLDRAIGGKVDPVILECARILRLPGTINEKKGIEKDCVLLQLAEVAHEINLIELSGLERMREDNISPEQIRRQYPRPDMPEIVKECRFVQDALHKPENMHEPNAFALIGLMAAIPPGSKATFNDQELTPRALVELVVAGASNSASLARQDFDRKWEDASRYGAQKCSTIAGHSASCASCPHSGRIPTPLALKGPEHVGSEETGFWVINQRGGYSHPHYGDLTRVYRREQAYVATPQERIFSFEGKRYTETAELTVKAWLERRVTPNDEVRETHCTEFMKKIMRSGALTIREEDTLFNQTIIGKLNCSNGVIDIVQGVIKPHSPGFGFAYVLPYDYQEGLASELFLDWLATITQNRTELMESILDVMAYCLWPTYDDHMFAFFVGEGANGKSTLLHVIRAMLGNENVSAISIQQLGGNRFAPANLEGKLANLSEESSGYEMTHEELNVIKNLSAGGELQAERKGVQGFSFQNKAKLIFSANKPPHFKESGVAIKRRMVVIPFEHKITDPDSRIEDKLIAEVPAIISMLVRRIQENIKTNGRFLVNRGGAAAEKAQDELLYAGNSVVEWAKESVESSSDVPEEAYVECSEAFQKYKNWCEDNKYKAVNKGLFSHYMFGRVVSPTIKKDDNRVYIAGKQVRIFKRTKWREEAYE